MSGRRYRCGPRQILSNTHATTSMFPLKDKLRGNQARSRRTSCTFSSWC